MFVTKVSTRGGALCTSIPRVLCRELNITRGDLLLVTYTHAGEIKLRRLDQNELVKIQGRAEQRSKKTV